MVSINFIEKSDFSKILQIEKSLFKKNMTETELNNFSNQTSFRIWKI